MMMMKIKQLLQRRQQKVWQRGILLLPRSIYTVETIDHKIPV